MRLFAFVLFSALSTGAWAAPGRDNELKHDWRQEYVQGAPEVKYVSKYAAPVPFSETGEPEATLTMEASIASERMTLQQVMDSEVADMRKDLKIADYLEDDGHTPHDGIATYIEEINGYKVGFIKYRVAGIRDHDLPPAQRHPCNAAKEWQAVFCPFDRALCGASGRGERRPDAPGQGDHPALRGC